MPLPIRPISCNAHLTGIGLASEQRTMQRHQALVDSASGLGIPGHRRGTEFAHGTRGHVRRDGDVALAAHQHQLDGSGVIARVDEEVLADAVQHFPTAGSPVASLIPIMFGTFDRRSTVSGSMSHTVRPGTL